MQPKQFKKPVQREAKIQDAIIKFLKHRQWVVKPTHGSMLQAGFPDLYISHRLYGGKWVEVKLPGMIGSRFTKAQLEWFPLWVQNGTPIWIMTAATNKEYQLLFKECNFPIYHRQYLLKADR